jgi:ATP-binding cassette subfamily B protein
MREMSGGRLITVLTSDVDAVKSLVASGIGSLLMSVVTLVGVVIFLFVLDWKLAFLTMSVMPFILLVFAVIFKKLGPLFEGTQSNLDTINKVLNESIVASALVRVLNANKTEIQKFDVVNKRGTELSMQVVIFFSALIPIITILSEVAILIVLWFGGRGVMNGSLTLGEMSAFFAYTSMFIWPFFVLSFSSTFISRAAVSLKRIDGVLAGKIVDVEEKQEEKSEEKGEGKGKRKNKKAKEKNSDGLAEKPLEEETPENVATENKSGKHPELKGHIQFKEVTLIYGEKEILKNISFEIQPHTKTAIIGPTGAGKTELLYLMTGLAQLSKGEIFVDGVSVSEWDQEALFSKMGMVFQDSIIFNASLKENILFKHGADESNLHTAIAVSELQGLVDELPERMDTNISERGINLSGGQKQRLMLARALAIQPRVLLLDDFTSRVDAGTEGRILSNIQNSFKDITLVSITQKIEPIRDYDHIIVLMEGELIAQGKHEDLLRDSIEYRQIYESQQSVEAHH